MTRSRRTGNHVGPPSNQQLARYFHLDEAGGCVVLLPAIPSTTPHGEWDSRLIHLANATLQKVVAIRGAAPLDFRHKTVVGRSVDHAAVERAIFVYEPKPGKQLEVLATCDGKPCAFKQSALRGQLIVCGVMSRCITEDSLELFRDILLTAAGVQRAVTSEGDRLFVVERETDGQPDGPRLIVAANVRGSEMPTRISVRLPAGQLTFPKSEPLEILPNSARNLWLNLPLGRAHMVYCTSEITPATLDRSMLQLRGELGTQGEIAFERDVRLNARRPASSASAT